MTTAGGFSKIECLSALGVNATSFYFYLKSYDGLELRLFIFDFISSAPSFVKHFQFLSIPSGNLNNLKAYLRLVGGQVEQYISSTDVWWMGA